MQNKISKQAMMSRGKVKVGTGDRSILEANNSEYVERNKIDEISE